MSVKFSQPLNSYRKSFLLIYQSDLHKLQEAFLDHYLEYKLKKKADRYHKMVSIESEKQIAIMMSMIKREKNNTNTAIINQVSQVSGNNTEPCQVTQSYRSFKTFVSSSSVLSSRPSILRTESNSSLRNSAIFFDRVRLDYAKNIGKAEGYTNNRANTHNSVNADDGQLNNFLDTLSEGIYCEDDESVQQDVNVD